MHVNFNPGQDLVFSSCENKAKVIRRPCDSTSGNFNETSVRKNSTGPEVFICGVNHGLTPLEKCQFLDFLDFLFLWPRKAFFRSRIS